MKRKIGDPIKTNYPLNFYFTIGIMVLFLALAVPAPFLKLLFYESILFIFLYLFIGRNACSIILNEESLKIIYKYPWDKNVIIPLNDIVSVEYEKSFYDIFSDKTRGGLFVFPGYCADKLILTIKQNDITSELRINCNTIVFGFDKIILNLKRRTFCSEAETIME